MFLGEVTRELTVLWSPLAGKKDTTADAEDKPGAIVVKRVYNKAKL